MRSRERSGKALLFPVIGRQGWWLKTGNQVAAGMDDGEDDTRIFIQGVDDSVRAHENEFAQVRQSKLGNNPSHGRRVFELPGRIHQTLGKFDGAIR